LQQRLARCGAIGIQPGKCLGQDFVDARCKVIVGLQFDEQFAAQHVDCLQRIGTRDHRSLGQAPQSTDHIQTTAL
jgi:hypothetical protein